MGVSGLLSEGSRKVLGRFSSRKAPSTTREAVALERLPPARTREIRRLRERAIACNATGKATSELGGSSAVLSGRCASPSCRAALR